MNLSIGFDIIEVERIESAALRWGETFEKRIFTPGELDYCGGGPARMIRLAARFAAKEALYKALGGGFGWQDAEVDSRPGSPPVLILHDKAKTRAEKIGAVDISLSISHTKGTAAAVVVALKKQGSERG
ncbi:MAG: holo-ACP synthase [Chloroflexi bacterium]|nr:holo-ACP synthase [Chloroflexota bacterium]